MKNKIITAAVAGFFAAAITAAPALAMGRNEKSASDRDNSAPTNTYDNPGATTSTPTPSVVPPANDAGGAGTSGSGSGLGSSTQSDPALNDSSSQTGNPSSGASDSGAGSSMGSNPGSTSGSSSGSAQ